MSQVERVWAAAADATEAARAAAHKWKVDKGNLGLVLVIAASAHIASLMHIQALAQDGRGIDSPDADALIADTYEIAERIAELMRAYGDERFGVGFIGGETVAKMKGAGQ